MQFLLIKIFQCWLPSYVYTHKIIVELLLGLDTPPLAPFSCMYMDIMVYENWLGFI